MILTAKRHGRTARDVRNLAAHLNKDEQQEARVVSIGNCPCGNSDDAMRYMEMMRDGSRATVSMHHISINPSRDLSPEERADAVREVMAAYGADDHAFIVWEHAKDGRRHYHLVLSHVGPDGLALDDGNSFLRLEASARTLEIAFGEGLTDSRRTESVAAELRRRGRDDVADMLISPRVAPMSSTTSGKRAEAERKGVDLPAAQDAVRSLWAASDGPKAFVAAAGEAGFHIAPGRKAGLWVVSRNGVDLGSLDRILKEKRPVIAAAMERAHAPEVPAPAPAVSAPEGDGRTAPSHDAVGREVGAQDESDSRRSVEPAHGREARGDDGPDRGLEAEPGLHPRAADGLGGYDAEDIRHAHEAIARSIAVQRLRSTSWAGIRAKAQPLAEAVRGVRAEFMHRVDALKRQLSAARQPVPVPLSLSTVRTKLDLMTSAVVSLRRDIADAELDLRKAQEPLIGWKRLWIPSLIERRRVIDAAKAALGAVEERRKVAVEAKGGLKSDLADLNRRYGADLAAEEIRRRRAEEAAEAGLTRIEMAVRLLDKQPGLARHGADQLIVEADRQAAEAQRRVLEWRPTLRSTTKIEDPPEPPGGLRPR